MNAAIRSTVSTIAVAVLVSAASSVSANDEPDFELTLPAGWACEDFDLTVQQWFSKNRVYKEWVNENGDVVRYLNAGKGADTLFINDDTGATYGLKANGSVEHTTINYDGSQTTTVTGHNILIWFPTDVPAGLWIRLYVGQVAYTVDVDGTWYFER